MDTRGSFSQAAARMFLRMNFSSSYRLFSPSCTFLTDVGPLCSYLSHVNQFSTKRPQKLNVSKSSQQWIRRQQKDPYVLQAKEQNYRARSAFKLIQIDDKMKILQPGMAVLDVGAAPGSWTQVYETAFLKFYHTQVIVDRVNSLQKDNNSPIGTVVAVDRDYIAPIDGALAISEADIRCRETEEKIMKAFAGCRINAVLSDMAPNATGDGGIDHEKILQLCYFLLKFSVNDLLKPGGTLLCKIWDGAQTNKFTNDLSTFFERVKLFKPDASRDDSAEIYVLARRFRGLNKS